MATELVVSSKTTTLIIVLLTASAATASSRRKSGRLFFEVVDGKKALLNAQLFCAHIRWRLKSAKGMGSADPECIQHSCIPISEAQLKFMVVWVSAPLLDPHHCAEVELVETVVGQVCQRVDCTVPVCGSHVKRVMKLVVERPATVGLGLSAICYVSHDAQWVKKKVVDQACQEFVVQHVKRVLTRSDCAELDADFFLFFFGHREMLEVRGGPADLTSASRTCPCCSRQLTC